MPENINSKYSDIQSLILPIEVIRHIQDAGLTYANSLKFDNIKEMGTAYSSFVAGCIFVLNEHLNKID